VLRAGTSTYRYLARVRNRLSADDPASPRELANLETSGAIHVTQLDPALTCAFDITMTDKETGKRVVFKGRVKHLPYDPDAKILSFD
jgi:hypothetical protein